MEWDTTIGSGAVLRHETFHEVAMLNIPSLIAQIGKGTGLVQEMIGTGDHWGGRCRVNQGTSKGILVKGSVHYLD